MIDIDAETTCILLPENNATRFILFQRLGFGSILGFIVAGVFVGPSTPGPVPVHTVDQLSSIAELGVVLSLRPEAGSLPLTPTIAPPADRVPGADALKPVPDCDLFGQSTPDVEFDLRAW